MTLASVRQSQCWGSVTVLGESWVIFWEVEYFQKEVWKTTCGLGHFPRVESIDLIPLSSLTSGTGSRACAPSPGSFAAHSCQALTCWQQQQHLDYPNPDSLSKDLSPFLESSFTGLPKVAEEMCGRAKVKGRSPRWSSCLGHAFVFVQEGSDPACLTPPVCWHQSSGGNYGVVW